MESIDTSESTSIIEKTNGRFKKARISHVINLNWKEKFISNKLCQKRNGKYKDRQNQ